MGLELGFCFRILLLFFKHSFLCVHTHCVAHVEGRGHFSEIWFSFHRPCHSDLHILSQG